jgi:ribosome-associated protein YbcJ (S4-like RNA binding protein)
MKLNERKIKKMRMKDTVEAADREIKILGGNK